MSPWKITGETNRIWQKQYLKIQQCESHKKFQAKGTHLKQDSCKNKKQGNQEEHRLKT